MRDIIPEKVQTDFKRMSDTRKNLAVGYLLDFTNAFENMFMEKIEAGIRRTNYIAPQGIVNIEKRMAAIPIEQVKDPLEFFSEMFTTITNFKTNLATGYKERISPSLIEKGESICDFFEQFGYMSPKQKKLIHSLTRTSNYPKDITSAIKNPRIFGEIMNCGIWKDVCGAVTSKIRNKEILYNQIEKISGMTDDASYADIVQDFFLDLKIAKKIETEKEETVKENNIPAEFLSLKKMREALAYVR